MRDIKKMDLNLLKALDALLDERSVTRAAGRLGLTQPAMSGMLQRLRESFADPLFARVQRGMVPTQRALDLALPIKQMLCEIDALLQPPVFDPSTARLTFRIAATDYALRAIAVPFLAALKRQAPSIRVSLIPLEPRLVQDQLERGDIDLAFLTGDNTPQDMHARQLFQEHYVCVMREGHAAAGRKLSVKQFCALDHALVSYEGGGFHGVVDEALEKLGQRREVSLSLKCFVVLPDILRSSDMVAVLPSRLVAGMDGLSVCKPPVEVPGFSQLAVWHERSHHDPAQRWLRELLFASMPAMQ